MSEMSEEDNTNQDNMFNLKGKTLYKDLSGIHTFYPNIKLIYQNEFCNKLNKISQNEPFDETQTNNNEEMNNGYDINNEALNNYSKDTVESQKTQTEISLDNNPELKNFNEDEELTQTKDINRLLIFIFNKYTNNNNNFQIYSKVKNKNVLKAFSN